MQQHMEHKEPFFVVGQQWHVIFEKDDLNTFSFFKKNG